MAVIIIIIIIIIIITRTVTIVSTIGSRIGNTTTALGRYVSTHTVHVHGNVRFTWPAWHERHVSPLYVFRSQIQGQNFRPAFRVACVGQNPCFARGGLENVLFSCRNPVFNIKCAFYCGQVADADFASMCCCLRCVVVRGRRGTKAMFCKSKQRMLQNEDDEQELGVQRKPQTRMKKRRTIRIIMTMMARVMVLCDGADDGDRRAQVQKEEK